MSQHSRSGQRTPSTRANERIPIVAGGTGFYIQALVRDIDFTEAETDGDYRRSLLRLADEKGAGFLHQMLEQLDPESARAIHPNNRKKVIRALEFYRQTGVPISRHNREQAQKKSPYRFCYFVVNESRETLYRRIDSRVDQMIRDGLVEEVSKLKKMGYNKTMVSMQGLGYKEILDYLDGTVSLPEAVAAIKQNTRHFAKRQITWFKREPDAIWLNREDYAGEQDMLAAMLAVLREKEIWKGKGNDV